jgi:hypothetical protein
MKKERRKVEGNNPNPHLHGRVHCGINETPSIKMQKLDTSPTEIRTPDG